MSNQSKFRDSVFTKTSNATPADITEIKTTLGDVEKQTFSGGFCFDADPAGGLQFNFVVPSGAVMVGQIVYTKIDTSGSTGLNTPVVVSDVDFTTPQTISVYNNNNVQHVSFEGYIKANGNAGDVQMQAAQAVSNVNATTIHDGLVFNVFNAN